MSGGEEVGVPMRQLNKASQLLNRGLACAAGCALIAMMFVTVAEMVLRMFGRPFAGTVEIVGWLAAVTTAFALGYTQLHLGHVSIDLLVDRLGSRLRAAVECLVWLASTLLFATAAWQVWRYAGVMKQSGSLSETLKVIVYPWVYLVSLGCGGLALALLSDFLKSVGRLLLGQRVDG